MTQRRKSRPQPILDDALLDNTASTVPDDTPSSQWAVEGHLVSPSRRVLFHVMLDDIVSHNLSIGDARWHSVRKHLLSKALDNLLKVPSMVWSPGKSHQKSRQAVLDNISSSSAP